MKNIRILSKVFCGILVAAISCTVFASAANEPDNWRGTFNSVYIKGAQGKHGVDKDGYPELAPDVQNTSTHSVFGMEQKNLDGTKAYTIVANVRLNGFQHDEKGMEATDPKAKVFGIDPMFRDMDGKVSPTADPIDGWFTAQDILDAEAKKGDNEFVRYYIVVTPKENSGAYEGISKLSIEARLTYMASSGEQYMKLGIESVSIYEGDYKVPGGIKCKAAAVIDTSSEEAVVKPGQSIYNQYASYKGSNKDFVNGNYNNANYDATYDPDGNDNNSTIGTSTGGGTITTDEPVTDIPQSGDKGIEMFILAICGAVVLGGTAFVLGKKRSKSNNK